MNESDADLFPEPIPTEPPGEDSIVSGSPFMEHFCPPRLGIIHLLGWTAALAVLLKFGVAAQGQFAQGEVRGLNIFFECTRFVVMLAQSATLVGFTVLARAWWRGMQGRLQPGHWMTALHAFSTLTQYSFMLLLLLVGGGDKIPGLVIWVSCNMVLAGAWVYAAREVRDGRRWKVLFWCFAVSYFLQFCVFPLLPVLLAVLLVTAVRDFRSGIRRDWIHWLGVGVLATELSVMTVGIVFSQVMILGLFL